MSAFGKLLAPIVVPVGGWDFVFVDGGGPTTVTVPAATYGSALILGRALRSAIRAEGGHAADTVEFSETGYCTMDLNGVVSITWASCDADLLTALGFAGSEAVLNDIVTGSLQHDMGWYPGVISLGTDRGVGLISDTEWQPENVAEGVVAGSGRTARVGPARPPYRRTLVFGKVSRAEMKHQSQGPICLKARWLYSDLYWYPDRADGTVADYGTQGDPGHPSYDTDEDCDYYLVTVVGDPQLTQDTEHPDLWTVQVTLNAEPA